MNIEAFDFVPHVGALPVKFDMLPTDVAHVLGPPDSMGTNFLDEREEFRGPTTIHYSRTDHMVAEIGLAQPAMLLFEGVDLLCRTDPILVLSQLDAPFECLGAIVFLQLGISVSGYHDSDHSQKAVTVFRLGRWDQFRERMDPWKT